MDEMETEMEIEMEIEMETEMETEIGRMRRRFVASLMMVMFLDGK